jgi:RNA polymerase sigma-70 factor (ECF subfamily)
MSAGAPNRRERSDDELVRDFRVHGDQEDFRLLFDRHKRRVYTACRVFLQDTNGAEDATQETFLRAFQNLDRFSEGNFGAWLMRIAKNVCIDTWRRQRRHAEAGEENLAEMSDGRSLENAAALGAAARRLMEEVAKLPEQQRRCIELKIEGHSYEETAELTGLPVAAVKSHLQNGRRMLWIQMEKVLG